jgi:hypothetical protein
MMKIDETGMTTKNMAKISQAGTFCCTDEGSLALRSSLSADGDAADFVGPVFFNAATGGGGQAEQFAGALTVSSSARSAPSAAMT